MADTSTPSVFTRRVAAAAYAAWCAWLLGLAWLALSGVAYVLVVHCPLAARLVSRLWDVEFGTVRDLLLVFTSLLKLIMMLLLLGCLFLSVWARRLRNTEGG